MALDIGARLRSPSSSFRARASDAWRVTIAAFSLVLFANPAHAAPARYQVLAQFPATTLLGDNRIGAPTHGFVVAPDGTMYGLGGLGFGGQTFGGALYTVSPSGAFSETYQLGLYDGSASGANADIYMPSLGMLNDGSLYGVTYGGGPFADPVNGPSPMGTVFTYSAAGKFTTLHTFYGPFVNDGAIPMGVVLGEDGNYYGITSQGGPRNNPSDSGVAFQLTPSGQETILYTFFGGAPTSFLMGMDGNIYGLLPAGALLDSGTTLRSAAIFRLTLNGVLTVLYQFNAATDGKRPHNLIQAADGNFYGTAAAGGVNDAGTVFEFSSSNQFSVLHAFDNSSKQEGFSPGPLVVGTDGNLYGSAVYGGRSGGGTVFRISPTSGVFTILHTFDELLTTNDGSAPLTITQHGARSFFGTAAGSLSYEGPSGVFKMVVPIRDDLNAVGRASILASGQNSFTTAAISTAGASQTVTTAVASGYYPAAIGDFNGDGVADLVWTSADNDIYIWFGGATGYTPKYAGNYPAGWGMVGAGDVDGDGMDDLIWFDKQTNQFAYWLMNGKERTGYRIFNITQGYYPVAIGDFDNDGKVGVIWTSANNDLYLWLSNGNGFTSKYITTYPAGWQVAGRGDLDGDGRDDLIWDTKDGASWGYWLMNGATIEKIVSMNVPTDLSGYGIAATSDYNGDGVSDILWSNGSQIVLGSNLGQCSVTVTCAFNMSTTPVPMSTGQRIFNSGIPMPANP
ncbi:MAG: choice-of-anchor tandem repeat GloVer-containing protein [Rhodanobacter sp.]